MYEAADQYWTGYQEDQERFLQSYQAILDAQENYGIELVDNDDFLEWTINGWENFGNLEEEEQPEFSEMMKATFIT